MNEEDAHRIISEIISDFVSNIHNGLEERIDKWEVDLSQREKFEVVGGLLARQVTLARQLAESPGIWTEHTAPIILRAMADVYISLAWILKDPLDRSRKFIHYGLGQVKLQVEHRKSKYEGREPTEEEQIMIEGLENWISAQRYTFLTQVNVGSWSETSIRDMAIEADCKEFYDFVYNPFSSCAHSMWHHIGRLNLLQCINPLHQYHLVPCDPRLPSAIGYPLLAAKYLEKTFNTFDEELGIEVDSTPPYDFLLGKIETLGERQQETCQENKNLVL